MSVNSFLNASDGGGFSTQQANQWLMTKTTNDLEPIGDRLYITSLQQEVLQSISVSGALVTVSGVILVTPDSITTLTNKTMSGTNNTFTNIPNSALSTATSSNTPSSIMLRDASGATNVGSLIVANDLTVNGTMTYINSSNAVIGDPLIQIANNNTSTDIVDIGQFASYNDGTGVKYTGVFRDSTDSKWKFFNGLTQAPTNNVINTSASGYTLASVQASQIEVTNARITTQITAPNTLTFATGSVLEQVICTMNVSGLVVESPNPILADRLITTYITPKTAGGAIIFTDLSQVNTHLSINSTSNQISSLIPHVFTGMGTSSAGVYSYTLTASGYLTINNSVQIIQITTQNNDRVLRGFVASGSLLGHQMLRVLNSTQSELYIDGSDVQSGSIKCPPHTVMGYKCFLDFCYDAPTDKWCIVGNNTLVDRTFQIYQWKGDVLLASVLPETGTYPVKINFNNSSGMAINGISGWTNVTGNSSGASFITAFTGTVSTDVDQQYNPSSFLQSTQSNRFRGLLYTFTDMTLTINASGMTFGNYYQVMMFSLDWNGNGSRRTATFEDLTVYPGTKMVYDVQPWPNQGHIASYVFRNTTNMNKQIKITNTSQLHIYGMAVRDLGATL